MHINSALLFEKYARTYFQSGMRVLEIGPSTIPSVYQSNIPSEYLTWDTLDVCDNPKLTYSCASEYNFPIQDNTYDIVLSGQVLEHVKRVWIWVRELARICKAGGYVITINPVSWPYHEAPVDCWRVFPDGMRALYEEAGLNVLLSHYESIEGARFRHTIPGMGIDSQPQRKRLVYRLLSTFGIPVECSYDTITVGQKP